MSAAFDPAPASRERKKATAPVPRPDRQFYASTQAFGRFGIRWFDPQIMSAEHFHGHIELNWLTAGSMEYLLDGKPLTVPSGRLVMFWAGIPHRTIGLDRGAAGDSRQCNVYLPLDTFLHMQHLGRLTELRAYACEAAGDATLHALASSCPALQVLDLCGATAATDAGVASLAAGCRGLREVGLGWVAGVGDGGVTALAAHCPGLASLSLHGNRLITAASLWALAGRAEEERGGEEEGGEAGSTPPTPPPPPPSVRPPLPLTALDVMGCVGIPAALREKESLVGLFPGLTVFKLQR